VLFHGQPGRIELVAAEIVGEPAQDWYVHEFGGGFMILDDVLGRFFVGIDAIEELEDLDFVSRADVSTQI
jgi:hypothetical protein